MQTAGRKKLNLLAIEESIMICIIRSAFIIVLSLFLGNTQAADRELASDGEAVRLTIDGNYKCSAEASIKVVTLSAEYFDQDAQTIQRLADTSRAILGFECPKISKINLIGYTDNVIVFRADASKATKWAIQTEPAPLELLALFFNGYKPDFFYLGTLHDQLKRYQNVNGITKTFQYKVYEKEVKRLIGVVDGNTDQFRSYLKNPGRNFESFEKTLEHYSDVLHVIKTYAPNHYPAYNKVYAQVSNSLKNDYWSARVTNIVEGDEKTVGEIVADAVALSKASPSAEYSAFIDTYIAAWINEEAEFIKSDIANAPLYELAWASEFVDGFPDPAQAGTMNKTKAQIQRLSAELIPLIEQRAKVLQSLAVKIIQDSGTGYTDTDTILETGFALAGEFEEAGYVDAGQALMSETINHINTVLKSDIHTYRSELKTMQFSEKSVTALQEQALLFEELSTEFEGFAAYKEATEKALNANQGSICTEVLKNAGVSPQNQMKRIYLGKDLITLTMLACDLYENEHMVSEFSRIPESDFYTISIDEANGSKSRFRLKTDGEFHGKNLRVQTRLGNEELPIGEQEWVEYVTQLKLPPPSGKPDANGIRECDRLAADPYDPKKLANGVDFEKADINPDDFDRALDSCIAALENDPEDVRQQFQLGRLLWYAGDQESAAEYMKLAASANYAPALYYQAEMLLGTSEDPDVFIDALSMFEASGKNGYARGTAMVKELNPDGFDFFKEIPPPTGKDILNALPVTSESKTVFGVTGYTRIAAIKVNSCFQTSATDFSCEYKAVLKCGMRSSRGNDFAIRLLSWAQQKDCDSVMPKFDTFRKVGDRKWKKLSGKG